MEFYPPSCPNKACLCHNDEDYFHYRKFGTFHSKSHLRKVQRFQCLACAKTFSEISFDFSFGQHKPFLNRSIYSRLCSGESQRAIARNLGCTPATVQRKIQWLAAFAQTLHKANLASGNLDTSCVQIDEQESFIETPAKPIGITYVVRKKTREILGFAVGRVAAKNRLSAIGKSKYGWTASDSKSSFLVALDQAKFALKDSISIMTDRHKSYGKWLNQSVAAGLAYKHQQSRPVRHAVGVRKPFDRLFSVNKVCANVRRDLATMARDTSVTNKSIAHLTQRLWIYLAFNNGYRMQALFSSTCNYIS